MQGAADVEGSALLRAARARLRKGARFQANVERSSAGRPVATLGGRCPHALLSCQLTRYVAGLITAVANNQRLLYVA
jgi:hypothetical protein